MQLLDQAEAAYRLTNQSQFCCKCRQDLACLPEVAVLCCAVDALTTAGPKRIVTKL